MSKINSIVEDDYYVVLDPDGNEIGRGSKRDKRYVEIIEHGIPGEYRIIQPEVKVVLIAASDPLQVDPPNLSPSWTGTPTPTFPAGQGGTYSLSQNTFDPESDTLTYSLVSGSWPTNVSMNSQGLISGGSGVVAGTTTGLVVSVDDGTNAPVNSPTFSLTITDATAKRWNPGHYLKVQGNYAIDDSGQQAYWDAITAKVDQRIEDSTNIVGVFAVAAWGVVNPTGTTYDWSYVDDFISNLASKTPPKKLILQINYKSFRGTPLQENVMPADLVASHLIETNSGCTAAVWRAAVMDRYIAVLQEALTRYNNNPAVEIITTSESAPSLGGGFAPGDYSNATLAASLIRMYQEVAPYAVKVNFAPSVNFLLPDYVPDLIEEQYQQRIMTAEADIDTAESDEVFRGLGGAVRDYRGSLGRINNASQPALGGKDDRGPPSNIINLAQTIGTSHLGWVSDEPSPNNWSQILAAIAADPTLATSCPSRYPSCGV